MWREILAFVASLAASPAAVDAECPKACAAVCVARASMEKEPTPETESKPEASDPPLVPVKPPAETGRIECRNGTCYYIDSATGRRYRVVR